MINMGNSNPCRVNINTWIWFNKIKSLWMISTIASRGLQHMLLAVCVSPHHVSFRSSSWHSCLHTVIMVGPSLLQLLSKTPWGETAPILLSGAHSPAHQEISVCVLSASSCVWIWNNPDKKTWYSRTFLKIPSQETSHSVYSVILQVPFRVPVRFCLWHSIAKSIFEIIWSPGQGSVIVYLSKGILLMSPTRGLRSVFKG